MGRMVDIRQGLIRWLSRLMLLIATPVWAEAPAPEDASHCAAVSSPDERLSCYDALFRPVTQTAGPGSWKVAREKSPLDDSETVVVRVDSNDPIKGRYGERDNAALILRCQENATDLYIHFAGHFMADLQGGGRVDYRIDKQPAASVNMDESNDHMALGLWGGGRSIPFIKKLLDAEAIYIRATPMSESSVEATFAVKGLTDAIAPLRQSCKW